MANTEIRSSYANDPDMAEILGFFVEDAPAKIERLQSSLSSRNYEQVRVFAHQLKGSAAGYGFESLTNLARELENSAINADIKQIDQRSQQVVEYLAAIRL